VGEGKGSVGEARSPAREALERGDFAEARRLATDDPDVLAYVRPDRVPIILMILSFLLFVPVVVYYVVVR